MNRRTFLKLCGLAAYGLGFGFGTTGCAPFAKDVKWDEVPDSEFSIQKFDDWFFFHKLYNDINPNLKMGQTGSGASFKLAMSKGFTPGIDYNSSNMYAAADGIVSQIGKIDTSQTGRAGGLIIKISHGGHTHGATFNSLYAHLHSPSVKPGESIRRGDKLGSAIDKDMAKIILLKRLNFVDPDNYGFSHSYMTFWDGTKINNENVEEKSLNQFQIVGEINKMSSEELNLWPREHKRLSKMYSEGCILDQIEQFRYIDALYNARPRLFPNLSPEKFYEYKKDFYANQPIVLTLPLKA